MRGFLPLTAEDRAIFARLPMGLEFEYRAADSMDYGLAVADFDRYGSFVVAATIATARECCVPMAVQPS